MGANAESLGGILDASLKEMRCLLGSDSRVSNGTNGNAVDIAVCRILAPKIQVDSTSRFSMKFVFLSRQGTEWTGGIFELHFPMLFVVLG